jgi:acetylcholinesterase
VFGNQPLANGTTQENALSSFMRGAWARFAKNPAAGPGWNPIGTGRAGSVLSGAYGQVVDGLYYDNSSHVTTGDWSLGVLGNVGDVRGGGVTVLPQSKLDYRCDLYKPIFQAIVGTAGTLRT